MSINLHVERETEHLFVFVFARGFLLISSFGSRARLIDFVSSCRQNLSQVFGMRVLYRLVRPENCLFPVTFLKNRVGW